MKKNTNQKILNPYYFSDRAPKVGFNIIFDSQIIDPSFSKINLKPKCPKLGIETTYIKKILEEMTTYYARLKNRYK